MNASKLRANCAKKIVRYGMKTPFYKLEAFHTASGVSITFRDPQNKLVKLYKKPGYYSIYRKKNDELECLYVGKSDSNMYDRINRWAKGVAGKLRHDEGHSGATKARLHGVRLTDEILVKVVTMEEAASVVEDKYMLGEAIDEWIAPLLKSKYNTKKFEEGASLEDFF